MKQTPNQLFEQLSKEFTPKKDKELINEELGQVVTLKPINTIEASAKEPFWTKFENFLAEGGTLDPIVNTEEKVNTKEEDEKIKAEAKKVDKTVENVDSHNYDYKAENINNVNAQEVLTGIQCEINYNKELTLDEAKELAVKNLAKDPLHYVKEGQFGVKGLGYTEPKVQENTGETYGGSGFSEKLKDGSAEMQVVKEGKDEDCGCGKETLNEAFGQVVTSGNPNSLAAQSGNIIRQMMAEKEEAPLPMDEMEDEGTAVSYSDTTMEAKGKDHDGDGDVDSDDYMAARDKAIKSAKAKKPKKESIDSKLAEIGKAGDITKMEAQLEFLSNHIDEKIQRVSSINEDDNLKELIDKSKMKAMQKEIKLLEKRKGKMEKMYEKMCGKKYKKAEMVDEMDAVSWNEKNNPTRNRAVGERDPKKVGKSTSAYAINEALNKELGKFGPDLKKRLESSGFKTGIFQGDGMVPVEAQKKIQNDPNLAGIAYKKYPDGYEFLEVSVNKSKAKDLEKVAKYFSTPEGEYGPDKDTGWVIKNVRNVNPGDIYRSKLGGMNGLATIRYFRSEEAGSKFATDQIKSTDKMAAEGKAAE